MRAFGSWISGLRRRSRSKDANSGMIPTSTSKSLKPPTENVACAWAWLGDMELDDVLLGLGAAAVLPGAPLAIGFLVNAFHCAEKGPSTLKTSDMFWEKRAFLDTFFSSTFFAVLDRYSNAGNKNRGWVGNLTAEQLEALETATGLPDELEAWVERIALAQPKMLHLLISGPLLGRGEEICGALRERILGPRADGTHAQIVIWMYAGSFNLAHSSEQDLNSLKNLVASFSPRVSVVETTLKSGAWLGEPRMFWGTACPTAWTVEDALKNPVGFDVSTDIQSANMFLEGYSSQKADSPRRGLKWIFDSIATARSEAGCPEAAELVLKLLRELEIRSLTTNLTKMVPPDNSSLVKVREAIAQSGGVDARQLQEAYDKAVDRLMALQDLDRDGGGVHQSKALVAAAVEAAKEYAQLYRGSSGEFLEAGCTEYFPKDKPFMGPRLDKRSIIRCMAQGALQGGPTADVLILLALILHVERMDPRCSDSFIASKKSKQAKTDDFDPSESQSMISDCLPALPADTRNMFRLEECRSEGTPPRCFSTDLAPGMEMGSSTRAALAPLVDAAINAVIIGAARLHAAGAPPPWGRRRELDLQHRPKQHLRIPSPRGVTNPGVTQL